MSRQCILIFGQKFPNFAGSNNWEYFPKTDVRRCRRGRWFEDLRRPDCRRASSRFPINFIGPRKSLLPLHPQTFRPAHRIPHSAGSAGSWAAPDPATAKTLLELRTWKLCHCRCHRRGGRCVLGLRLQPDRSGCRIGVPCGGTDHEASCHRRAWAHCPWSRDPSRCPPTPYGAPTESSFGPVSPSWPSSMRRKFRPGVRKGISRPRLVQCSYIAGSVASVVAEANPTRTAPPGASVTLT